MVVARDSAVVSTHEKADYCTVGWDWGGMGDGGWGMGGRGPVKKMMSMAHWHLGLAGLAVTCCSSLCAGSPAFFQVGLVYPQVPNLPCRGGGPAVSLCPAGSTGPRYGEVQARVRHGARGGTWVSVAQGVFLGSLAVP